MQIGSVRVRIPALRVASLAWPSALFCSAHTPRHILPYSLFSQADDDASMEEAPAADATDAADKDGKPGEGSSKPAPEPTTHRLENPARLTPAQRPFVEFDLNQRYQPVHSAINSIIMLKDTLPGEVDDDLLQVETPTAISADEEEEADMPGQCLEHGARLARPCSADCSHTRTSFHLFVTQSHLSGRRWTAKSERFVCCFSPAAYIFLQRCSHTLLPARCSMLHLPNSGVDQ